MPRRAAAALAVLTLSTAACALPPKVRMVGGVAVGAAGVVTLMATPSCVNDSLGLCPIAQTPFVTVGALLLAAGIGAFVQGVAADDKPEVVVQPQPVVAQAQPVVAVHAEPAPPPAQAAPVTAPGAQRAIVSRIENRFAIQASLAAAAGHCDSAVITATELAKLDAELYSRLIAADALLARCHGL